MLEANATLVDWQGEAAVRIRHEVIVRLGRWAFPFTRIFRQSGFRGLCPVQEVPALLHRDLSLAFGMKFPSPWMFSRP